MGATKIKFNVIIFTKLVENDEGEHEGSNADSEENTLFSRIILTI